MMIKFISFDNWLNEKEQEKPEAKYGCVLMDTKIDNWKEFHLAGIDKDDVHVKPYDDSYGLEEQPHMTVLYGIHEDEIDPEVIAEVIKKNMKPITLQVDEIDIFEGDEYDVVKYNLPVTKELRKYRDLFLKFPNTQTHKGYHPHMTIAYVSPGKGKKYKRKLRESFDVTFTKGIYSWHGDEEDPEATTRKEIDLEKDYESEDSK